MTYQRYEKNDTDVSTDMLIKLADFYGVSTDYLLGREPRQPKRITEQDKDLEAAFLEVYRTLPEDVRKDILEGIKDAVLGLYSRPQMISIRYINAAASAGLGELLSDYQNAEDVLVPLSPESRKADFVLRVHGDSMEPMFSDGDHVLVKQQDTIDPGEIGIFAQNGEGFIKKLGENVLISLNEKYSEIPLDDSSRCFGKVLGKIDIF
jgi:phage repressor protein C with HTH and peptisase S24 domain